jgi:hypothetical protein
MTDENDHLVRGLMDLLRMLEGGPAHNVVVKFDQAFLRLALERLQTLDAAGFPGYVVTVSDGNTFFARLGQIEGLGLPYEIFIRGCLGHAEDDASEEAHFHGCVVVGDSYFEFDGTPLNEWEVQPSFDTIVEAAVAGEKCLAEIIRARAYEMLDAVGGEEH